MLRIFSVSLLFNSSLIESYFTEILIYLSTYSEETWPAHLLLGVEVLRNSWRVAAPAGRRAPLCAGWRWVVLALRGCTHAGLVLAGLVLVDRDAAQGG